MATDLKASHPFHSGRPGEKGGSRPAVNNNQLKACSVSLDNARGKVSGLKGKLPNPVSRLKMR